MSRRSLRPRCKRKRSIAAAMRIALSAPQGLGATDILKSPPEILNELEVEASAE